MAFMKHVGKHGDRKVCILFRQVPGEDHMSLVVYPETLQAHWQDSVQKVLESTIGQSAEEFADALHRSYFPDGRPILETLHQERMIKKVRSSDIIVTPSGDARIRLDELNKMLNEMKQAAKSAPGYVAPPVLRAGEGGALTDRDIAANMLSQAQVMEANAKSMIAEAARMKKDAERMDPTVSRPSKSKPVTTEPAVPVKRTRGPNKVKTAVADGTQ